VDFVWDEQKNEWLQRERLVSFEEIADLIKDEKEIDIIENPARAGQQCAVLWLRDYTWLVPYVIDEEERIVLKTAFPSRKFHRIYGERK
jgi:uncharacterized DUF497 family protein